MLTFIPFFSNLTYIEILLGTYNYNQGELCSKCDSNVKLRVYCVLSVR